MERLLLCALALLRLLDAVAQEPSFQGRTTRGLPLPPEGKGEQPQHLEGPAGQGTPSPSLTAGSLTTRLDRPLWPTDGSGRSFKENTWEYWPEVAVDLVIIACALLSVLICCCYASLCGRTPRPDPSESEQLPVQRTSSFLEGQRDYGAITDADAEGHDSTFVEEEEEDDNNDNDNDDYDCDYGYDYDYDYDYYYDDDDDISYTDSDSESDYDYDYDDTHPLLWPMDID